VSAIDATRALNLQVFRKQVGDGNHPFGLLFERRARQRQSHFGRNNHENVGNNYVPHANASSAAAANNNTLRDW
jgi:hypothetical protein